MRLTSLAPTPQKVSVAAISKPKNKYVSHIYSCSSASLDTSFAVEEGLVTEIISPPSFAFSSPSGVYLRSPFV